MVDIAERMPRTMSVSLWFGFARMAIYTKMKPQLKDLSAILEFPAGPFGVTSILERGKWLWFLQFWTRSAEPEERMFSHVPPASVVANDAFLHFIVS